MGVSRQSGEKDPKTARNPTLPSEMKVLISPVQEKNEGREKSVLPVGKAF